MLFRHLTHFPRCGAEEFVLPNNPPLKSLGRGFGTSKLPQPTYLPRVGSRPLPFCAFEDVGIFGLNSLAGPMGPDCAARSGILGLVSLKTCRPPESFPLAGAGRFFPKT